MKTLIKVKNSNYSKYEELLVRKDTLEKEAKGYLISYVRIFGELTAKVFQLKIECIRQKKAIALCQAAINKGEFPNLEKAAGFSINETKKKLDELSNMVDTVDKLLNKLNTQDEFIKKANNSLEGSKQKVNGFKKKEEKNKDFYHETIKFFGYKEKDKYYDENGLFFKMLLNFFNEVDKQLPKFDVKRVLDYQNRMVGKKVDQSAIMRGLMTQLKQKVQG